MSRVESVQIFCVFKGLGLWELRALGARDAQGLHSSCKGLLRSEKGSGITGVGEVLVLGGFLGYMGLFFCRFSGL